MSMDEDNTLRNNSRMKTTWNELAKARMKELGVTQEKLAEALGKTQGGVGHWLRGMRNPSLQEIGSIFEYLGITDVKFNSDGTFTVGEVASKEPIKKQYEYPILSSVEAGTFSDVGTYTEREAIGSIATEKKASSYAFWLEVKGSSMTAPFGSKPSFPEGSYILVEPALSGEVKSGDLVVALKHNQEGTFKRFFVEEDGRAWLEPLNQDRDRYRPMEFSDGCRIVGKVIAAKWPDETFG